MLRDVFLLLAFLPAFAMYALHVLLRWWIHPRRSAIHLAVYIFFHLAGVFLMVYSFGMIFRFCLSD